VCQKDPGLAYKNVIVLWLRYEAFKRARAVGMLEAGVNQAVVAREFGVHKSTISRLQSKFRETNTVADRPRAGRTCVTTLVRTGLYV